MTENIYSRLLKYLFRYWHYLLGSVIASLGFVLFNSASIWLTASLINSILTDFSSALINHQHLLDIQDPTLNDRLKILTNYLILKDSPLETLRYLCFSILVVFTIKNFFFYLKNILLNYVQLKLITEIRIDIYRHFHTLSLSFFNKIRSGELTSIIINDVANMRRALSNSFQKLLVEPLNIIIFLVLLFIISFKLALIATVIIPLSGLAIVYVGRSIRRKSKRTAIQIAGITNILMETLGSMRVVKAFVMERYEVNRFNKEAYKYFHLLFRRARLQGIASPITELIGVILGVVLLWIGGVDVLVTHEMASEDFIRFIFIMFSVLAPVRILTKANIDIQIGIASAQRVFNIIDTEPEISDRDGAQEKQQFKDKVQFKNVKFNYNEDDRVLQDISLSISKGEIVALVGPSGAGKSTIADLIPRFFDVSEGEILMDDIDIRDIRVKSLRTMMGIVTQETILFNDTIRANISYGLVDVDDSKVIEAARAANAWDFIEKLPEGLATQLGDRGVNLSGGQRQRLAIARALLKNPPILILDEATSSLDTESEKLVQEAIENLMEDRTVLVIAHRLSTIQNADRIIVLNEGRVVETGTHNDLIANDGLYRYLHSIQFNSDKKKK